MLVLTRKTGQSIVINDNIEVTIVETKGDAVKIGIVAPKEVTIYRHEIYEEIKKENVKTAQQSSLEDISVALNMLNSYSNKKQDFKIIINKENDKKKK